MLNRRNSLVLLLLGLMTSQVSTASDSDHYLTLGLGHVAVFDDNIDDPYVYKLEYRFSPRTRWLLAPALGAARSGNGASFLFVDLEKDFFPGTHWVVTPSFGLGSFDDGKDVKLGHDLEFRTGLKVAYQFDNKVRLGIGLFHLSNGGLSDRNPGTEPMFLSLSFPF